MGKSEGLFKALPATRFYGSKRKHLDWLAACLKGYEYDSVLDMFGGTGAVSMMFERLGKRATYHDSARFNYRQAKALFGEPKSFDFQLIEDMLHSVRPEKGFISSAFDRAYFTRRENNWLDGYVVLDRSIADDINRDALFYCVVQSCLQKRPYNLFHRNNLYLRTNVSGRSFGNATTWEKSFVELSLSHLTSLQAYVSRNNFRTVKVLAPRRPTQLSSGRDLIYIDPPYIRNDRHTESYLKRYHFLEGLSEADVWREFLAKNGNGADWYQSSEMGEAWGGKGFFEKLLTRVLDRHQGSICALSYMEGGYPSVGEIKRLFSSKFKRVKIFRREVRRVLSAKPAAEILVVGEP